MELFHAHCALIDQLFLQHNIEYLASRLAAPSAQTAWKAVIIDDRPTRQARICILNTLLMTRLQAEVIIFTTPSQINTFSELLEPWLKWVTVASISDHQGSGALGWNGYNQLLKKASFWKALPNEQILIFQPDSLLIQPLDLGDLDYAYAGSPWNKGKVTSCELPVYTDRGDWVGSEWINQALCQTTPEYNNGNGGLSIRNKDIMAQICQDHASQSPKEEAEDIFFARHLNSRDYNARLPSQGILRQIFSETHYADSHGFHGSWFYLDASEQARLYEKHVKHIIGLLTARGQ